MNRKKLILRAGTLLGIASLGLAHHVPVGLSYTAGPEILQDIVFFTGSGLFGVPPYKVGDVEAPDHGEPVGLSAGESFTVTTQGGSSETIVFEAADFADIATADMDEVVDVINDKATLFEASETNGYVVFQGLAGGPSAFLHLTDAVFGPLSKMGMTRRGRRHARGSDTLSLTLSIPDPNLDLSGRPYFVFASSVDGSFQLQGQTVPVGLGQALRMVSKGSLGRGQHVRSGELDATSDATWSVSASDLDAAFGHHYPDKLYLAFVVFGPNNEVAFVSNRFTVDFQ